MGVIVGRRIHRFKWSHQSHGGNLPTVAAHAARVSVANSDFETADVFCTMQSALTACVGASWSLMSLIGGELHCEVYKSTLVPSVAANRTCSCPSRSLRMDQPLW